MHKILFYNKFIIFLYMFRALLCLSSGGQNCIVQHLVSSHCVGGRPVHRLREDCLNLCTGRQPTQRGLSQPVHRTQTYTEGTLSTCAPDDNLHRGDSLNLCTGRQPTQRGLSQLVHRTATYTEGTLSTYAPDGNLHRGDSINLCTGRQPTQ